jgi:UBX domain
MPSSGDRVTRRFIKTDLVLSLYDFVDSLGPEKLQLENANNGYLIMQSMPKREYSDKTVTLAEAGLHPRAML